MCLPIDRVHFNGEEFVLVGVLGRPRIRKHAEGQHRAVVFVPRCLQDDARASGSARRLLVAQIEQVLC